MEKMEKSEFILSRHAKKISRETPEEEMSEKYPGITKEGEKETREKTKEIAGIIENLPEGSAIVLSGVSKVPRARATLEVYADELRDIFKDRKDVIFSSGPRLKEGKEKGPAEQLKELKEISEKMKESKESIKAIVHFPLWIKQFTASPEEWDKWAKYFETVKDEIGQSGDVQIAEWFEKKKGPNPDKIAEDLLLGLKREEKFFRKFFPDNEIVFINVDHSGELDALFTYLANKGEITKEGFQKIGGEIVKESEFGKLSFLPDGNMEFEYRDNKFSYKNNSENKEN